ncbi:MAG TPA: hypothetical protein VK213_02250 [Bacteroidales bacterium]|nr:hypothetical protein [Bacteroidales bacterium]
MDLEKQFLIAKGAIKRLPGMQKEYSYTGGTIESRYCYAVWLRHLLKWSRFRKGVPQSVAELGPGDSLGTGIAALLSGSSKLYALDVIKYWDNARNLRILNELVELFKRRFRIPDNFDYPRLRPIIDDYSFPSDILTDEILEESLSNQRIEQLRNELSDIDNPSNSMIKYKIPWQDQSVIKKGSVDFIYSQATLECIEDLEGTYRAMCLWIKPGGLMSHTIDFKSHKLTAEWNGHWKFSDFEWRLVKGRDKFLINREPLSKHIELHNANNFWILMKEPATLKNRLGRNSLASKFRSLSEEDLTTSGVYLLSEKSRSCNDE